MFCDRQKIPLKRLPSEVSARPSMCYHMIKSIRKSMCTFSHVPLLQSNVSLKNTANKLFSLVKILCNSVTGNIASYYEIFDTILTLKWKRNIIIRNTMLWKCKDSDSDSFACFLHINTINKTNLIKNKKVGSGGLPLRLKCLWCGSHPNLKKKDL